MVWVIHNSIMIDPFYRSCLTSFFHCCLLVLENALDVSTSLSYRVLDGTLCRWILIYVLSLGDKHDTMFDYFL